MSTPPLNGSTPTPTSSPSGSGHHPVRRRVVGFVALCVTLGLLAVTGVPQGSPSADAFGTVHLDALGQRVVHEPITRTLECGDSALGPVAECWQPLSMSQLAGTGGTFGGVGEPDNPLDGFPNPSARHCDNVDWGYDSYNTVEDAQRAFDECLSWYQAYMDFAVTSAARLVNADGTIDAAETDILNLIGNTYDACRFPDPQKGKTSKDSAKCNVINGFGRALHLYQDFWSHSNWGDVANPDQPVGLTNPVGLGRTDQPAFFSYPGPTSLPLTDDLITGCDDSVSKDECRRKVAGGYQLRTSHSMLNKDNGMTSSYACAGYNPLTVRGMVKVDGKENFQRAMSGACEATRRAWNDLQAALVDRYGAERAAVMVRTITHDTPLTECSVSGQAARSQRPPVGKSDSARSVDVMLVNRTGASLRCGDAVLDGGEWASYPPSALTAGGGASWRTQSNGLMTGTEGRVTFAIDGTDAKVTLSWSNPYVGSNSYTCQASDGYSCSRTGGSGNNSSVTFTVQRR
jgi:hypothetical protein